ncbi:MAG: hypothetical protein IPK98_14490 [Chloracidobacterium sp.]|nr:hypothetical protein [Chloracidobacterium sp.]
MVLDKNSSTNGQPFREMTGTYQMDATATAITVPQNRLSTKVFDGSFHASK